MNTKKKLVVLTGAGISAESGLQTFRDGDGLWEGYNVQDVATPRAWQRNPQLVLDFYNYRRAQVIRAQPNAAHYQLAQLETDFDVTIITQNIDDLHERGGSTKIIHLHGEILKMRSEEDASLIYDITGNIQLGDRAADGAQLRPHIVWFEEPVPLIEKAIAITATADLFVVAGTSLVVYPAAGLLQYASPFIPKFIVDKRIPAVPQSLQITAIEKPATEGMMELTGLLKKYR